VLKALRRHLSYANVMATIAAFIALGGSSYATLQLTGRDIKNRSIPGKKIKRNSIGPREVAEKRLGTVRRARDADRLGGRSAASYRVRCPTGTTPLASTCIETQPRSATFYTAAASQCDQTDRPETPGRRLPSHDELMTALDYDGITLAPGGELTSNVYPPSAPGRRLDVLTIIDATGNVAITPDTVAGARQFRCVATPIN
jgi:hypothetical protein